MNTQSSLLKLLIIFFLSGHLLANDHVLPENDPSLPQSDFVEEEVVLPIDTEILTTIRNERTYFFYAPMEQMVDINFIQRQLQVNYTLQMAQHILYLLHYYQNTNNLPAPSDEAKIWLDSLLINDPFIASIGYVEQSYLTVILKDSLPVVEGLQGKEIRYEYYQDKWFPRWSLSELLNIEKTEDNATITQQPPSLVPPNDDLDVGIKLFPAPIDFFYSMGIITDYCHNPAGYIYPKNGMVSDRDWCPVWHSVVMPPRE